MPEIVRLTVAQALVKFLSAQYSESDGEEQRLFAGCFGIFGHGNVAGIGQALLQAELEEPDSLRYILGRNEQAMVHTAVAYARMKNRLQTYAVSTSVGPGATNMLTGAALATINRLPVLLLPADTFADRSASPLLQELELPDSGDVTVNDAFRPVSRYFDRIWRPEQLPAALLAAMRVLTDPAETGAVTLCFPQDVQAEAYDWPTALFQKRVWHVGRQVPERSVLEAAAEIIRSAEVDRGRRWSHIRPRPGCVGSILRSDRHPCRTEPSWQGHFGVRPSAVPRGYRLDGHHSGECDCRGRRCCDRDRYSLLRLHDREPDRLPEPWRTVRQHQCRRTGCDQACRAWCSGRRT